MPPRPLTRSVLPIDAHVPTIVGALRRRRAAVIAAEPGAGKTTRVPPALLECAGSGDVVVLEPRRLAARMAARRVAAELGEELGHTVGYTVRFDDRTGPATRLRFVTEGVFVRRLAADPELAGTSVVVFDELHERHLHTDLALALARRAQERRDDLRLVAMSATLDSGPVAAFLDAELIEVPGRSFPVRIEHLGGDAPLERQVASAVRRLLREEPDGDVLVFLPGAAEIRRAQRALTTDKAEVCILHGDLSADAQERAVRPGPRRKVVLSTNIAESSVTIDGVVAVVDSGLARRASVSPWTGLSSLQTVRISQASATQRAGRAGRTRPGRCLRLYSEHELRSRPAHDPPEIVRADLAELVLLLRSLGQDPERFPFFEPPPAAAVEAADALLELLDATRAGTVTDLGRTMLRLPTHPRLARVALTAVERGVGARGCLLAALAAERDLRLAARSPLHRAEASHEVGASDLLARLEAFEAAEAEGLRDGELRARELDPVVYHAARRSRDQLARALRIDRRPKAPLEDEEEALLVAILTGFPDRVGRRRRPHSTQIVFESGAATLTETSVVREAELLVATEIRDGRARGGSGRAVIHAATRVEPETLLEVYPERIQEQRELTFDEDLGQVVERHALTYGAVLLDETIRRDPEGPEVARTLAEALWGRGLNQTFDLEPLEAFRRRARFAIGHGLPLGDVGDEALRAALRDLCTGRRTAAELQGASLLDALRARLDPTALVRLDRMAPAAVALPRRKRCPVHYEADRPPWIASRLQDFFGLEDGPRIAEGKVPLVLHLLAPNRRAVQVTTDLAGFWERHYPTIRRQLQRRYPKHDWPEDPRQS